MSPAASTSALVPQEASTNQFGSQSSLLKCSAWKFLMWIFHIELTEQGRACLATPRITDRFKSAEMTFLFFWGLDLNNLERSKFLFEIFRAPIGQNVWAISSKRQIGMNYQNWEGVVANLPHLENDALFRAVLLGPRVRFVENRFSYSMFGLSFDSQQEFSLNIRLKQNNELKLISQQNFTSK